MVHHYRQSGVAVLVAAAMVVPLTLTSCATPDDPSPAKRRGASSSEAPEDESERRFKAAVDAPSPSGPIVAIGHGSILLPRGEFVSPTPGLVRSAQRYYIDRLRAQARPEDRASFDAYRRMIEVPANAADEFTVNGDLVTFLIDRVRPVDAARLRSINRFLVQAPRLFAATPKVVSLKQALAPDEAETPSGEEESGIEEEQTPDGTDDEEESEVVVSEPESLDAGSPVIVPDSVEEDPGADVAMESEELDDTAEPDPALKAALAKQEQERRALAAKYGEQCRDAGVPTPPPWNHPDWEPLGEIAGEFTSDERYTEIFRYVSTAPAGVCYALPRGAGGTREGEVELLGVICQGKESSRSCFWDNVKSKSILWEEPPPEGEKLPEAKYRTIDEYFDGANGGIEECTDCHRGENAFIIHPNSKLNLGANDDGKNPILQTKGWVTPIVPAHWPANRKPAPELESALLGEGLCATCHSKREQKRFGELSGGYCGIMHVAVKGADRGPGRLILATMPPPSDGPYASEDELEMDGHWRLIEYACSNEMVSSLAFEEPKAQSAIRIGADASVLSGDFDYNGRADLAYVTAAGEVMVSFFNGGQFTAPTLAVTLPKVRAGVAVGDFNGDGTDDLAIARPGTTEAPGAIEVALGRIGEAAFGTPTSWSALAASAIEHVVAADFDNDRRDDLMVFASSGQVTLQLSDGRRFSDKGLVEVGYVPGEQLPLAADIDGDSYADLALVPKSKGAELVLAFARFMQVGTFERELGPDGISLEEMSAVRLADADGDGLGDLIAVSATQVLVTRFGYDEAKEPAYPLSFQPSRSWSKVTGATNALVDDLNADGRADLITIDADGAIQVGLSQVTRRTEESQPATE